MSRGWGGAGPGTGWSDVKGSRAEIRKTGNGWFQVRVKGEDHVSFSNRDSDQAYREAVSCFPATPEGRPIVTESNIIESDELDVADKFPDLTTQESEHPAERAMFDLTVALSGIEEHIEAYVAMMKMYRFGATAPILADLAAWQERLGRIREKVEGR